MIWLIIITLLKVLILVILLLISVAYFTLAERKLLAVIQRRRGPNVIGVYGLLQPLSDGLKLLVKEIILPSNSNQTLFLIAPMLTFIISLLSSSLLSLDTSSLSNIYLKIIIASLYLFSSIQHCAISLLNRYI